MTKPLIPDGLISRAVRNGLLKRKELLDGGMTEEEADLIVGRDLKAAWETSSKQPCDAAETTGKYLCPLCFDSGWIIIRPSYWEQMRLRRLYGDNPPHQDYMQKCDPCTWIKREREKRLEAGGEEEGLVAAGQTKRRNSKFSRY